MKIINRFWIFFVGTSILVSCTDLDTAPANSIFSEDQKMEVIKLIPERLGADISGMYSFMSTQFSIYLSSGRSDDYGYPMVCLSNDLNGPDMVSTDNAYNWFTISSSFEDRIYNYANPYMRFALFYNQIKMANDILLTIPEGTTDKTLLYYKGQAMATRAFDYMSLVQLYQFTYKGNEDKPAIPIVTEIPLADKTSNPRATVQVVYNLIMSDLDSAIVLLDGYIRTDKGSINQQVAYGLRARANLLMQNWAAAAADAADAMVGYTLLSKEDVSVPSFYSANASSWMWALLIRPVNIEDGYSSWPSELCSFSGNSYTANLGCYKMINTLLWSKIPLTDVRKGWWVDKDFKSPLIDNSSWPGYVGQAIGPLSITGIKIPFLPYTNVKFGPYNGVMGNGDNASDWCMMRAEEMLFICAEGLAMSSHESEAKVMLEDFVKNNRNPSYTCTATTAEALQNEIWFQRRVELWGEGFGLFDMMRLKKNMVRFNDRIQTNFPETFSFNIRSDDGWLLMRIPQKEINSNAGIPESANNTDGEMPKMNQNPGLTDGVTD